MRYRELRTRDTGRLAVHAELRIGTVDLAGGYPEHDDASENLQYPKL